MLELGTTIEGRYIVRSVIGQGGMGTVYLGHLASLATKLVAIKVVRGRFDSATDQERALDHFRREAALMASLDHPNMVHINDFFTSNGIAYLVMDYVDGVTLDQYLKGLRGFLPAAKAMDLVHQLCDVVEYFHRHDPPIVFRDLKPGNIVLTRDGKPKLIDFGIARTLEPESLTSTFLKGSGTHGYAPIEQYMPGSHTDTTSDIYALGGTIYTIFTGKVPPAAPELATGLSVLTPPQLINPAVPVPLGLLIGKMMQMHKVDRCQSIAEVRHHFDRAFTLAAETVRMPAQVEEPAPTFVGHRLCLECGYAGAGLDEVFCTQCGSRLGRRRSAEGSGQVLHTWRPGRTGKVTVDLDNPLKTRSAASPPRAEKKPIKAAPVLPATPYLPPIPPGFLAEAPLIQAVVQPPPQLFGLLGTPHEFRPVKVVDIGPKGMTFQSVEAYKGHTALQVKLAIPMLSAGNSIVVDVRVGVHKDEEIETGIHQTVVRFKDMPARLKPLLARALQQERRVARRFKRSFQVVSKAVPGYRAISLDVSVTGLAMLTSGPVPVQTSFELWLDLDDTPTPGESPSNRVVQARVVYSALQLDSRYRVGVVFENMTEAVAEALFAYLRRSN